MVLEEISSLLLLSAEVSGDAARLEVLNIQLVILLFFFLGNPQQSLSTRLRVSLDGLLAMPQHLGDF